MVKWADVVGYEGLYRVSSCGAVFSVRRNNYVAQHDAGQRLCYRRVTLYNRGSKRNFYVHRLVLFAFHGAPPADYYEACHLNELSDDNRIENLVWGTPEDNQLHRDGVLFEEDLKERDAIRREHLLHRP